VYWCSLNVEKILKIPKIQSGTEQLQAETVYKELKHWKIESNVVAMSSDTTVANTAHKNWAFCLLEDLIGRKLPNLACRHHVHEIIVFGCFKSLFDAKTTSPGPEMFVRFRNYWPLIEKTDFKKLVDFFFERMEKPFLKTTKQNSIDFRKNKIESYNYLRNDNRELADLSLVVLGEKPRKNITFKICGVCHHAL
jgi:hypothetical protein